MIPIKKEFDKKTNFEIKKEIEMNKKINVNYYPILAKRINQESIFESFLYNEISSPQNIEEVFWGFIKIAWIPLISIIEYSNLTFIKKAIDIFQNWPEKEKENFVNYIKNEKDIAKYFK